MTTFSREEISLRLSHTLDCLGYSPQMVQIRKNFHRLGPEIIKSNAKIVGSKGECLVKMFESDYDVLVCLENVLVV